MATSVSAPHRARARRLMLTIAAAIGVALMLFFDLWHCPVAELFGVPCPGCGMSRAALALATGDLPRAVALHPLSPLVLPWLALVAASALARDTGSIETPRSALGELGRCLERATPLLVALLVSVWVARFFGAFGGPVPVSSHLLG